MSSSTPVQNNEKKVISDQEALQHIKMIDGKMKGKNTTLIVLLVLLLISIGGNVAQFLHLI